MKVQVSVITLILAIVITHVEDAVSIPERTDVSNKTGRGLFRNLKTLFHPNI